MLAEQGREGGGGGAVGDVSDGQSGTSTSLPHPKEQISTTTFARTFRKLKLARAVAGCVASYVQLT